MENWVKRNIKGDPVIWIIVIIFYVLSIWVVYSAVSGIALRHREGDAEYYLVKHVIFIGLSVSAMWFVSKINYMYYGKIAQFFLILSWGLLSYTYLFGETINNASSWLVIPLPGYNISFQPSDLAKTSLIITICARLAKRQRVIHEAATTLYPILARIAITFILIALSDVGSALTTLITAFVLLFIGRVPIKQLATIVLSGFAAVLLFVLSGIGQRSNTVINRIGEWWGMLTGDVDHGLAYQVEQAYIAIARGGFWGVGLGQSQQRYFLPEAFSDYIYAIIIEEHGLKIGVFVIFLYLALLYRAMKAASQSDKAFGGLLSIGLAFSLVIQAIINMMVVVGLGPVTGLPLPFLSMGGTSLLFSGASMGILLSISRKDLQETENQNFNTQKGAKTEE